MAEFGVTVPRQDTYARWTKGLGAAHCGYKNRVVEDRKDKLNRDYQSSAAPVHDSPKLSEI